MGRPTDTLKRLVLRLPARVQAAIRRASNPAFVDLDARYSFSQEGEDLLIGRLFGGQATGFYVDVGAHHPTRFSNTHLLYRKGWNGINIDPTPGSMVLFNRARPRDINLELAVSTTPGTVTLTTFNDPALNTLSPDRRDYVDQETSYSIAAEVEVTAATLESVLAEYVPTGTRIDLLTVDVEGRDFDVLQSNDWDRFRPRVLLIEVLDTRLEELEQRPEIQYLRERGYRLDAKLFNSVLLLDDGS